MRKAMKKWQPLSQALIVVTAAIGVLSGSGVEAQPREPRLELGAHFAAPVLSQFDATDFGLGGRASYRVTEMLAVEGEVSFYPRDFSEEHPFSSGRLEGLFGVKVGPRFGKLELFGKLRPGFFRFSEEPEPFPCILIFPPPLECSLAAGQTVFALDLGGGLEVFPTARSFIRVDLGDILLSYPGPVLSGDGEPFLEGGFWSHNFRFALGGGFRF